MRISDEKRLDVLRSSSLLDTEAEAQFDRLTRLASRSINAPVALISLVDEDRQFFKSHYGLEVLGLSENETPLSHSYCSNVVTSESPLVVEAASTDDRVRHNPATVELNIGSYCGVPLRASSGEILGSFCVIDVEERTWSELDLAVLNDLAEIAMTEIELRIAYGRERAVRSDLGDIADALQAAMLPPKLPTIDGLELASAYLPHGKNNTVGGDFYDVFPTHDDRWTIVVGDVCGKGAKSARTSIMVRDFLRASTMRGESAPSALRLAHEVLRDESQPFVAVSMLDLSLRESRHEAQVTLAGQPRALLIRQHDVSLVGTYGSLIGGELDMELEHQPATVTLDAGDTLVLFTDGVTDAPGSMLDENEIAVAIKGIAPRGAQAAVDAVVGIANDFRGPGREPTDDICVVAVSVPPLD